MTLLQFEHMTFFTILFNNSFYNYEHMTFLTIRTYWGGGGGGGGVGGGGGHSSLSKAIKNKDLNRKILISDVNFVLT